MQATWITDVRDLGIPTLLGAIAGALITHYASRSRAREEAISRDERQAARDALAAARAVRVEVAGGGDLPFGQLHNRWQDEIQAPLQLIRDPTLEPRVRTLGSVLWLAVIVGKDLAGYPVIRACQDVEDWLQAWLKGQPPPAAHLPPHEQVLDLVRIGGGRISFDPLLEYLQRLS